MPSHADRSDSLVRDRRDGRGRRGRAGKGTRLIVHATSLGGVETLIERRARYPSEVAAGTPATLLRVSVGIEDVEDLWHDLEQALEQRTPEPTGA